MCDAGGVACYVVGGLTVDWHIHGELALVFCTVLKGVLILHSAVSHSIYISYVNYIIIFMLYDIMMVISK